VGELYGEVSRYGGRPTKSQIDRAVALSGLIDKAGADYEKMISDSAALNAKLVAAKLEPLKKLSREEFDKRQ
jgi:hypothetical protein